MHSTPIEVKVYDGPLALQAELGAWLEERPAVNNLLLGLLYRLVRRAEAGGPAQALLIGVFEAGVPKLAFLHMPPRTEIVFVSVETGWEAALQAAVAHFQETGYPLMGSVGPEPQNTIFAKALASSHQLLFNQLIWETKKIEFPRPAEGSMRLASPKEVKLLVRWVRGFFKESLSKELSLDQAKDIMHQKFLERNFYVWDHDGAQCMAGVERPTAHGMTVVLVYTPPQARGKGYASNLVAQMTDLYLRKGRKFLCLHTDAGFATSNKIYKSIGYYEVGQGSILHFEYGERE
jgi:uncharacterized protein